MGHHRPDPFRSNVSNATELVPGNRMVPLAYNIWNMRIGIQEIGEQPWWDLLLETSRRLGILQLDGVIGSVSSPRVPGFQVLRQHPEVQLWIDSKRKRSDRPRQGEPKHLSRAELDVARAFKSPPFERLTWLTVNVAVGANLDDAYTLLCDERRKLDQFLRRRFNHAAYYLLPEFDVKLIRDVDDGLFPVPRWKSRYVTNQLVYKVHFHGILYVPDMGPDAVEVAFQRTKNGKRSRMYSGTNQVRCKPLEVSPGTTDAEPDTEGAISYVKKYKFVPPVMRRMHEGFSEWLVLWQRIYDEGGLAISGGLRKPFMRHCPDCGSYSTLDEQVEAKCSVCGTNAGKLADAELKGCDTDESDLIPEESIISRRKTEPLYLYWVRLLHRFHRIKSRQKKLNSGIRKPLDWLLNQAGRAVTWISNLIK